MPTHTRDFSGPGMPDIKLGEPIFGGYRMILQMRATMQVAIGDNIQMFWTVPGDEYWRLLGMHISDNTAPLPQGWEQQQVQQMTSVRFYSAEATLANPTPLADWTHTDGGQIVWARGWDGATYLTYLDVLGNLLHISAKDPTFQTTIWHPGSRWLLYSKACEKAGASALPFAIKMLVDRFVAPANVRMPEQESARVLRENADLAQILHASEG